MGLKEKLHTSPQSPGPRKDLASQKKLGKCGMKVKVEEQHSETVRAVVLVATVVAVAAVVVAVAVARWTKAPEAVAERMDMEAVVAEAKKIMAEEAAAERMKKWVAAAVLVVVMIALVVVSRLSKKPLKVEDVMNLLCTIVEEKKKKGVFNQTMVGLIGGLFAGPPGAAVAGAVGGLLDEWMINGQFKPISQILMPLPSDKKQNLFNEANAILKDLDWRDTEELTKLVMGSETLKEQLLTILKKFLKG